MEKAIYLSGKKHTNIQNTQIHTQIKKTDHNQEDATVIQLSLAWNILQIQKEYVFTTLESLHERSRKTVMAGYHTWFFRSFQCPFTIRVAIELRM